MKSFRHLICITLVVAICLSCIPFAAWADDLEENVFGAIDAHNILIGETVPIDSSSEIPEKDETVLYDELDESTLNSVFPPEDELSEESAGIADEKESMETDTALYDNTVLPDELYPWSGLTDEEFAEWVTHGENNQVILNIIHDGTSDVCSAFFTRCEMVSDKSLFDSIQIHMIGLMTDTGDIESDSERESPDITPSDGQEIISDELQSIGNEDTDNRPPETEEEIPGEIIHIDFGFTVNPVYQGVISESGTDVPEPQLQTVPYSNDEYISLVEAVITMRNQLKYRFGRITINYISETDEDHIKNELNEIIDSATAHTGVPTEGDYLKYHFYGYQVSIQMLKSADGNLVTATYSMQYCASAVQEQQTDNAVSKILSELHLEGKSDYEKILAIYNYLCSTVSYSFGDSSRVVFSAYGALVNKCAVCQGISTALYRLLLAAGIDNRIVSSETMLHCWNIINLGGTYYYADATWDLGNRVSDFDFFLIGKTNWVRSHSYGDEIENGSFAGYSISNQDYSAALPSSYQIIYDANGGIGAPLAQVKKHGVSLTLSYTEPTRDGYQFHGWATDRRAVSAEYLPGAQYTRDSDATLYAVWKEVSPIADYDVQISYLYATGVSFKMSFSGNKDHKYKAGIYVASDDCSTIDEVVRSCISNMTEDITPDGSPVFLGDGGYAPQTLYKYVPYIIDTTAGKTYHLYMDSFTTASANPIPLKCGEIVAIPQYKNMLFRFIAPAAGSYTVKFGGKAWSYLYDRNFSCYADFEDSEKKLNLNKNEVVYIDTIAQSEGQQILITADNGPVDNSVEAFVKRLYTICLDREADKDGLNGWVNNLKSGKMTGIQVANQFIFSQEFILKNYCNKCYVEHLYKAFMGRDADKEGLNGWVDALNNRYVTREAVFNGFATSDEFTGICADYGITRGNAVKEPAHGTEPTNFCAACGSETWTGADDFVKRLYEVCLDRSPDDLGRQGWSIELKLKHLTGKEVAKSFVFSKEFEAHKYSNTEYIKHLYKAFMGREADKDGLNGWVAAMQNGYTREMVFDQFAGSKEFEELCLTYGINRG